MDLLYSSTRNSEKKITASQAILKGLADDGGLFVPESIPALDVSVEELSKMSYQQVAYEVMKLFLTDFTEEELKNCINRAYDSKFDTTEIAPLKFADGAYYLELFHGSTIAFKDMALSILPHLLITSAKKNNVKNEIVILTATSGDTGKAAMAGFADVEGTQIIVFYPKNGVSPIQEKQMLTQKGANTHVVGIHGNFDQAQSAVKAMFNDKALAETMDAAGYQFSSANSINIGRLVPQIVYYVYAYSKLFAQGAVAKDEKINIVVPTGNFGNILAAFYAKNMGIPVGKTQVHVGVSAQMRQELSDLQKSIEENGEVIKKITTGLKQFELVAAQKGIDVSKDPRRTELLRAKMKTQADIAESQKAVDRLEELVKRGENAKISVVRKVYSGCVVTIDQQTLTVKELQESVCFQKKKEGVVMISLK